MKFKVGDRIAVYERGIRVVGNIHNTQRGLIDLWTGEEVIGPFHPKQCRKLKKPREVWLIFHKSSGTLDGTFFNPPMGCEDGFELVHYREVRTR